jgi:hypothetical protein
MNDKKITKKLEKINKMIQENNVAFKTATKAQKRVMIAQDVLAQIKAKRYVADSGTWVDPTFSGKWNHDAPNDNASVQQMFASKEIESCSVCALGSMFMSCTNLNNHTTFAQFNCESDDIGSMIDREDGGFSNGLDRFFTKNQLTLIEIYFEKGDGYFSIENDTVDTNSRFYKSIDFNHVYAFYDECDSDQERLTAIMKNIIKNDGTFVPEKLKVMY